MTTQDLLDSLIAMFEYARRPKNFRLSPINAPAIEEMTKLMRGLSLHTVCESARCPNRADCFSKSTATFMILGNTCTRNCTFCAVNKGEPPEVDPAEPNNVVAAIKKLGIKYAVITSVTRDDLPDGGAFHFAEVVKKIQGYDASILIEVLIPDFKGSSSALKTVTDALPSVLNHNVETVPRLYPEVRPEADFERSVQLLRNVKAIDNAIVTKSGIMLGLGESHEEVLQVMADLREAGCGILTIGQYLSPSLKHHPIMRYAPEEEFAEYEKTGKEMGFAAVISGPLVRSSFHAAEAYGLAKA
jgi:lipoic acid synthetase